MMRQIRKAWFTVLLAACVGISGTASAMDAPATTGKLRLQPYLSLGTGAKEIDLGTTTDGDNVSISGGGGGGMGITAGFGFSPRVDVDFTLGYAESVITPAVDNADGYFERTFLLVTLKYRIPVAKRFHIKLGGGVGYYMPGDLNLDFTESGGYLDVVKYENATGAHAVAEFEFFMTKTFTVNAGWKYYSVTYQEESGTRNGIPGYFYADNIEKLDGSGFDFMLSLAQYF